MRSSPLAQRHNQKDSEVRRGARGCITRRLGTLRPSSDGARRSWCCASHCGHGGPPALATPGLRVSPCPRGLSLPAASVSRARVRPLQSSVAGATNSVAPDAKCLQHRCSSTELLVVGQVDANDIAQLVSAIFLHAVAICGALFHCQSGLLALGCTRPGRTFQPSRPSTNVLHQPRVLLLSFHLHRRGLRRSIGASNCTCKSATATACNT